ncbi:hypothetical protein [Dysgonomonas sp. BGC7]|uniref:hypothetical protein n=1 Tax=Dysgonomonas sp. BGC7 TaxID=1658008 RepID=UPI00068365D6|nr:hypothetical protein [Dysgonomonas sp. BGC7]MBD8388878.1 hypothetical protein [Dysgonomonas sp. BGC7]
MTFKLKTWHFLLAIIILVMAVNIISLIRDKPPENIETDIIETVESSDIEKIISNQACAVLFCNPESDAEKIILHNLNRLNNENSLKTKIYYVPVHNTLYLKNGSIVSGTPSILLVKEGREINRIMGIVSYPNLKMIIERFENINKL